MDNHSESLSARIRHLADEVGIAVSAGERNRRVLVQLLMTHGGSLEVDPTLAQAAKESTCEIEFCDGRIAIVERNEQ